MWPRGGHKVWNLLGLQLSFIEVQLFHPDSYAFTHDIKMFEKYQTRSFTRFRGARVPFFLSPVRCALRGEI